MNTMPSRFKKYRAYISLILSVIMLAGSLSLNIYGAASVPDIAGHWAENAIRHSLGQGFVNVFEDGTVRPDQPLTRGEFAFAMNTWMTRNNELLQAMEINYRPLLTTNFHDVPVSHPFFAPIRTIYGRWLIDAGTTHFRPDDPITRLEVSESWVALFQLLGNSRLDQAYFDSLNVDLILGRFGDSAAITQQSRIANSRLAAAVMVDQGFIFGFADDTFRPDVPMPRGEFFFTLAAIDDNFRHFLPNTQSNPSNSFYGDGPRIIRLETRNHSIDGFYIDITVNRAAVSANAEVLIAPGDMGAHIFNSIDMTTRNIYRNTTPLRLSHMQRRVEHADYVVFTYPMNYSYLQNHSLFVMLNAGGALSNIERSFVTFIGSAPGPTPTPTHRPFNPAEIMLFNLTAGNVIGNSFEVQITVNDMAVLGNADVFFAFTTSRGVHVNQSNIMGGAGLTSRHTWINAMQHISTFGGTSVFSDRLTVPFNGRFYVHAVLRSGNVFSVIHSDVVVVGEDLVDADVDLISLRHEFRFGGPGETVDAYRLLFTVNQAALARNPEVIFTRGDALIPNVTAQNLLHPVAGVLQSWNIRLNDLTRIPTEGGAIVFASNWITMAPGQTVHAYAMLRTGTHTTRIHHAPFTAPAIVATPTPAPPTPSPGVPPVGSHTVTLTGAGSHASIIGGPHHNPGSTVTINAGTIAGQTFTGWTSSPAVTFANPNSPMTTFVMPSSNVTVTANWQPSVIQQFHQVVVLGSQLSPGTGSAQSGQASYLEGDVVIIRAGTRAGFTFGGWTVDAGGAVLAAPGNPETTFIMPASPVTVTATWDPIPVQSYLVTVNGSVNPPGLGLTQSGQGNHPVGAQVAIRAGTNPGFAFDGWTIVSGGITLASASSASTTFTMPANPVEVTANWVPMPIQITGINFTIPAPDSTAAVPGPADVIITQILPATPTDLIQVDSVTWFPIAGGPFTGSFSLNGLYRAVIQFSIAGGVASDYRFSPSVPILVTTTVVGMSPPFSLTGFASANRLELTVNTQALWAFSPAMISLTGFAFTCPYFEEAIRELPEVPDTGPIYNYHLAGITELDLHGRGIESLDGIQYFTSLATLDVGENRLTEIDMSGNPVLTALYAANNQLETINVLNNAALTTLDVGGNRLQTIDLSGNRALERLWVDDNELRSLDLRNNRGLRQLNFANNSMSQNITGTYVLGYSDLNLEQDYGSPRRGRRPR